MGEWLGIVVIALVGMLQHELEMGDQSSVCPCRDDGLMHVQRTAEARAEGVELSIGCRQPNRIVSLHERL